MPTCRLESIRPSSKAVNATASDVESWGVDATPNSSLFFCWNFMSFPHRYPLRILLAKRPTTIAMDSQAELLTSKNTVRSVSMPTPKKNMGIKTP